MNRNPAPHKAAVHRRTVSLALALLVSAVNVAPSSAVAADEILSQRRAYVEAMSATEKETLRRNQQRFAQLDEQQRQKLRDLHAKISTGPESERLSSVLRLYHQWMKSLPAGERLELLALPAEQRVRAIKQLIERQEREEFQGLVHRSLSVEDREAIIDWLANIALRSFPPAEQQRLRAIEHPMRRRMEIMSLIRRRGGGMSDARFLDRLNPTAEDRQALVQQLSQPAQDAIAATQEDPEKRRLVQNWVNAAIFSRRDNRPQVARETLDAFFAKLDAAERDYLNNLPPDRKREELERMYMRTRVRRPGERPPPFGPGRRRGAGN